MLPFEVVMVLTSDEDVPVSLLTAIPMLILAKDIETAKIIAARTLDASIDITKVLIYARSFMK